jgi:hypothetical protein
MEKLYLRVDLHKRSCWVTVLDADGHLPELRWSGMEKWELADYFGRVRKLAAVAVAGAYIALLAMCAIPLRNIQQHQRQQTLHVAATLSGLQQFALCVDAASAEPRHL